MEVLTNLQAMLRPQQGATHTSEYPDPDSDSNHGTNIIVYTELCLRYDVAMLCEDVDDTLRSLLTAGDHCQDAAFTAVGEHCNRGDDKHVAGTNTNI